MKNWFIAMLSLGEIEFSLSEQDVRDELNYGRGDDAGDPWS